MKYYKVLKDGKSCNGGNSKWSLPKKQKDGSWKPGKWMPEIEGELIPCENGYHACEPRDLVEWLGEEIYELEYGGELLRDDNKTVFRKVRLLRKIETWTERAARLFACDCAEEALRLVKEPDPRSAEAVKVARLYADGKATKQELDAEWSAAYSAAWSAANSSAYSAAWSAANSSAWSAANSAAYSAALGWQTKKLFEYLEEEL